jgi:hypothetical protein
MRFIIVVMQFWVAIANHCRHILHELQFVIGHKQMNSILFQCVVLIL